MSKHISAKPGEIADRILLPGDPLRAKYIAEKYLEDAACVSEVRNALCYTGTYKGEVKNGTGDKTAERTISDEEGTISPAVNIMLSYAESLKEGNQ